jgi:2-polyprenyl-3-methyl-5-hydroxy-6-metoxy-1,4-benzoquinol methylase
MKKYLPERLHGRLRFHPCATAVLSKLYDIPKYDGEPFIAVNCAFDRPQMRYAENYEKIMNAIALAVKELSKNHKIKYYTLHGLDTAMFPYLDAAGVSYEKIYLNTPQTTPEDIIRECAAPELFVGMRGHAQLIPFGCGTPILNIISHDKLKWFLEDINRPEWGIEADDADLQNKLVVLAEEIIASKSGVKKQIASAMDELYEILNKNIADMAAIIAKPLFIGTGLRLSRGQKKAVSEFNSKLDRGVYKTERLPCVCGAQDDVLAASIDRYGFNLRTVICRRCGLVRADPYYNAATLQSFYNNEYRVIYDDEFYKNPAMFSQKFNNRRKHGKSIANEILQNGGVSDFVGKKVFDIGCSLGGILAAFQEAGADCYGCDFNEKYVSYGNSRGLHLSVGDYSTLAKNGAADIIIVNHVLEHIANPAEFLRGIRDMLKDDGLLFVAVPLIENIGCNYRSNLFLYLQNAHVFYYTMMTLKAIMQNSGYEIVSENSGFNSVICRKGVPHNTDWAFFDETMRILSEFDGARHEQDK